MPRIAAAVTVVIVLGMCIGFNTVRYPAVWKMVAVAHQPPGSEQPEPQSQSLTFSKSEPSEQSSAPIALRSDSSGISFSSSRFSSSSVDPIPFPTDSNSPDNEALGATDDGFSDGLLASSAGVVGTESDVSENSTRRTVLEGRGVVPHEPPQAPADSYYQASSPRGSGGHVEPDSQPVEAAPSMKYASGAADLDVREQSTAKDRLAGVKRRPLVPVAPVTRPQFNGARIEGSRPPDSSIGSRRTEKLNHRVRRLPPLERTADSPYQTQDFTTAADRPIPIYPSTHEH